ncbi:hypothetical protein TNO020_230002 [Tenacibaculum piscium]|uniref:Uncharacterized protein n=1 Tax=Tenacibaculum piscium TaxID=1458515 RepID=A0A2H1YGH6_9FLAO|nr:hypothetical protein TNO020_230002 [Tenacibaculum piscium]
MGNTVYNLLLVIYLLTKILGGFSIPFLFTKLVARKTQQIIYKNVVNNSKKKLTKIK